MTYTDCIGELYSLVDYERLVDYPREFDLSCYRDFLKDIGDPQERLTYPVIITGTKGKGSTAEILLSCLKASGKKVGIFTSPHLIDVRERIRVGEERIPEEKFASIYEEMRPFIKKGRGGYRTVFEVLTAIAVKHFLEEKTDYTLLEVGLGGKNDATNVANPVLSIVTPVSLDHTHVLGETVSEIAERKMGVARKGVPVVSAPQSDEALAVVERRCGELDAKLHLVGRELEYEVSKCDTSGSKFRIEGNAYEIPLLGEHQVENAATAYLALKVLGEEILSEGFGSVALKGRLQVVEHDPLVVLDAAHNAHSASVLASSLETLFSGKKVSAVVSMLRKKDYEGFAKELGPALDRLYVTRVDSPRAMAPEDLASAFEGMVESIEIIENSDKAFRIVKESAGADDLVLVTGSFYLVGETVAKYEEN